MKATTKESHEVKINITISDKVKDHGNDPFFEKKAAESKAFLEKNGFPEEYMKRR